MCHAIFIWHDRVLTVNHVTYMLYFILSVKAALWLITHHHSLSHRISSYLIASFFITSHHAASYLITSYHISSHLIALCHATLQAWPIFAFQHFSPIPPNRLLHSRHQRKRNGRVLILTTDSKDEDKILKTSTTAGIISKALREPLKHLK